MALLLVLGAPLSVPAAGTEFMYSGWTERVKGIVEVSASLRARGNYEEAGRKLDSLDLAEHDDPDGYAALAVSGANYALGLALFQIADYPGAVHRLGLADDLDSANVKILYALGNAYRRAGRLSDARRSFDAAIAIDGTVATAHCNLGNTYYAMKEYSLAGESYAKSLDLDPDHVASHYMAGRVAWRRRHVVDAIAASRMVLELDPEHAKAKSQLLQAAQWLAETG